LLVLSHRDEVKELHLSGIALTVGSFDGVHLGHQALISRLKKEANGGKTAILTFDPHPDRVLSTNPTLQIFSKQDQIDVFAQMGIDYLFFLPFDKAIAGIDGAKFAQDYIFDLFQPKVIVVGYDFAFGKNRSGNFELLVKMAKDSSSSKPVNVLKVEAVREEGEIVSSSLIRKIIQTGDMERVQKLLGRPFYILGHVKEGRKLGRELGFPTANIAHTSDMIPGPGVYFCTIAIGNEFFNAVCNVGINPTVSDTKETKIECHILNFNQDIYKHRVQLFFHKKLRDEQKFPNVEALRAQITKDIELAKTFIK
jgi:riboflavin kinase / FMN adenylyltransferase